MAGWIGSASAAYESTARIDSKSDLGQNVETPLKEIFSSGAIGSASWAWVELNYRPHAYQAAERE